jgi:glycosyltransferase involved in cell wall biosynthesis
MRILVIVPHYFPAIGGVETYSRAVAIHLKKSGHEVTIVTTGEKSKQETIDGMEVIRLKPWLRLSNTPINPLWYFSLRKIIRTVKPDVIHTHSPVPFLADMAVLASGGRPIHSTYHAGSMKKGSGGATDTVLAWYESHILPRLFKRAASVGAVLPEFAKKHMKDPSRLHFTPPGIDTSVYSPDPSVKRDIDVLFAGRIEKTSEWKGVDVLIEALGKLKQTRPTFQAKIIGSGDAVESFQQIVQKNELANNIEFVTTLRGPEVVPYYQRAKMVILPSKTEAESFGMVLAEGMACGAVAVGSRIGGIPNVIEDGKSGVLVTPGDAQDLARAINRLLDNSALRERLAKHGATRVKEHFSLESMVRQNTELLEAAAKRHIIHVVAYYPPYLGGMEAATSMLTQRLHKAGRRITVVTSKEKLSQTRLLFPFSVRRLSALTLASTPLMPGLLFTLLRMPRNSVFHVHIAQAGIPEVVFLAAKLRRLPVVAHLHGDVEASSAAGLLLPLYKKLFLGFVLRRADSVIVPTKTYAKTMKARYHLANSVHVIPTGIDESFFFEKTPKESRSETTIVYGGRLTVEKNVDLLLEAVAKVPHPIRFIVVGDGPLRKRLEKQARLHSNTQHIEFVGRKSSEEMRLYYNQADIFVLASDYESQSLVTLEAMASGTPVIVANVDAVNEIVGAWGVLAEKSVDGFAHAITRLIEDPTRQTELTEKSKERAAQFSWQTLLKKFEDVYDSLA